MAARLSFLLALAGAVVLPASLFFDWYTVSFPDSGDVSLTGWQSFEIVDALFVVVGLVALASLLGPRLRMRPWPGGVLVAAGFAATVVVALQLVEPPPLLSAYEESGSVSRDIGAWLGLGGSLLMLVGALLRNASRPQAKEPDQGPRLGPPD
jgi:hypothetical protein